MIKISLFVYMLTIYCILAASVLERERLEKKDAYYSSEGFSLVLINGTFYYKYHYYNNKTNETNDRNYNFTIDDFIRNNQSNQTYDFYELNNDSH